MVAILFCKLMLYSIKERSAAHKTLLVEEHSTVL